MERTRKNEVDPSRLIIWIYPSVDRASLHARVAGFHVDYFFVVEMARWKFSIRSCGERRGEEGWLVCEGTDRNWKGQRDTGVIR